MEQKDTQSINPSGEKEAQNASEAGAAEAVEVQNASGPDAVDAIETQDASGVNTAEAVEAQNISGADTAKAQDASEAGTAEVQSISGADAAETQNASEVGAAEMQSISGADAAETMNAPATGAEGSEAGSGVSVTEPEKTPDTDVRLAGSNREGVKGSPSVGAVELPSLELLEAELKKEQYKRSYRRVLKSTAFSLMVVAAVAVLIAVLLLPVLQISGTSMTDTLQNEDIVVAVNSSKFKTGDVVAFYYNNNILIKRVIASSGDWVDIDEDGNVYVNEVKLDEPYVKELALGECDIDLPYQVPDKKCFVMGDHRATSIDSRSTAVGCVSDDAVVGKILFRVWPLSEIGFVK